MKNAHLRRQKMFTHVREFAVDNSWIYPEGSFLKEQQEMVAYILEQMGLEATAQETGSHTAQHGSATKAILRASLHEELEVIHRIVGAMSHSVPGLEKKFLMPRSGTDQALLTAARAFVVEAEPFMKEFIRRDLPETFIQDLKDDIAELEEAINTNAQGIGQHVKATAAMDPLVEKGMNAVREMNAVIRHKYRNDAKLQAAWLTASHVEHEPRARKAKPQDPQAPKSSEEAPKSSEDHEKPKS